MKHAKLQDMKRGWFVGNFFPSAYKTTAAEVAIKEYKAGVNEAPHYHKLATEITVIQKGRAIMFNQQWKNGDIVVVEPGDITGFHALEDTVTVVVKIPGAINDKYLIEKE